MSHLSFALRCLADSRSVIVLSGGGLTVRSISGMTNGGGVGEDVDEVGAWEGFGLCPVAMLIFSPRSFDVADEDGVERCPVGKWVPMLYKVVYTSCTRRA